MDTVLLAGALAILIAIAISLKALFAIERRLFRMESHILKLSNKILEEEDQIELLLRKNAQTGPKFASQVETTSTKTSKTVAKKPKRRK
jgi:hypothetical protein